MPRYEWGHHGDEPECPHVSVVQDDADSVDSYDAYRLGKVEDIFDLRLYGHADGSEQYQLWLRESQQALENLLTLANIGLASLEVTS